MNLNKEISKLIENHGYEVKILDNRLAPDFQHKVLIDSYVNIREDDEYFFRSRLDVHIDIGNGESIIECFGDIGSTKAEAVNNNLINFARSDLHVILGVFNGRTEEDDHLEILEWQFNDRTWKVYIGNCIAKSNLKSQIPPPSELYDTIDELIKKQPFTEQYHWIRMYYAHLDCATLHSEFLIDNEVNEYAQEQIANLDWEKHNGFYSFRSFVILKQIETPKPQEGKRKAWRFFLRKLFRTKT